MDGVRGSRATPLPAGVREGPAAKRWVGEGLPSAAFSLTPPLLPQWVPPSPLKGEG